MADEQKVETAATETPKAEARTIPELRPGMTVKVHEKIKEVSPDGKERDRIQVYEGMILVLRGSGLSRTMTVRKNADGWGVEKIYPVLSPVIDKIEVVKQAKVRRAVLKYLSNPRKPFGRKLKEKKA